MTVVMGLGRRGLTRFSRLPSILIPVLVMPAFFVVAFSGTFDGVTQVDAFPTPEIVNWVAAYGMMQGGAIAGLGAVGVIATDIDSGFMDRLLVSPIRRSAVLLGPLAYSAARTIIPITIVIIAALTAGADLHGPLAILTAYVAVIGFAMIIGCIGMAVVLRTRDIKTVNLVQTVSILMVLSSIGQVPMSMLTGWLHTVARINPVTNLLRLARQGFLGPVTWDQTWPGLVVIGVGLALSYGWARLELTRFS